MSPLPDRARLGEIAVKGVHLALRQAAQAPEQRAARRLARQATGLPEPAADAPVVAFLTPRDWAAHVHWDALWGQALRLRGARVHFITCGGGLEVCDRANTWEAPPMPCTTCHRYVSGSLAAHGFSTRTIAEGWRDDDPWPWAELDAVSAPELTEVEADGYPLGALVDIPVKWFLMAAELDDDPLAPLTTRRFLRTARRLVRGIEAALDRIDPDVVVLCNGLFVFEAVCWEVCRRRGISVVTYERGFIKETLVIRRDAAACMLDIDEVWAARRPRPLDPAEEARLDEYLDARAHGRQTIDRFWVAPRFVAPDRRGRGRLVALFTNLTWDSAVIGQEVAFESIQAWVAHVVEAFGRRPEHELVIRIHPAEVKLSGKQTREPMGRFLAERFPELPANVRVIAADDPTSSYPLMEACDIGMVFTSTTGLELALAGKPVIVAGRTHYRGKGFTVDVSDPDELDGALDKLLADPAALAPDVDLVRRYAHAFFFEAPVRSPGVEEHILGLARITIGDLDELAPGRDPDIDRMCDLVLSGPAVPSVDGADGR